MERPVASIADLHETDPVKADTHSYPKSNNNTISEDEIIEILHGNKGWNYGKLYDNPSIEHASLSSDYENDDHDNDGSGDSVKYRATLSFNRFIDNGKEKIIASITNGDNNSSFECNPACPVFIRFENEDKVMIVGIPDESSKRYKKNGYGTIYLDQPEGLFNKILKSDSMYVAYVLNENDLKVRHFSINGLKWKHLDQAPDEITSDRAIQVFRQ